MQSDPVKTKHPGRSCSWGNSAKSEIDAELRSVVPEASKAVCEQNLLAQQVPLSELPHRRQDGAMRTGIKSIGTTITPAVPLRTRRSRSNINLANHHTRRMDGHQPHPTQRSLSQDFITSSRTISRRSNSQPTPSSRHGHLISRKPKAGKGMYRRLNFTDHNTLGTETPSCVHAKHTCVNCDPDVLAASDFAPHHACRNCTSNTTTDTTTACDICARRRLDASNNFTPALNACPKYGTDVVDNTKTNCHNFVQHYPDASSDFGAEMHACANCTSSIQNDPTTVCDTCAHRLFHGINNFVAALDSCVNCASGVANCAITCNPMVCCASDPTEDCVKEVVTQRYCIRCGELLFGTDVYLHQDVPNIAMTHGCNNPCYHCVHNRSTACTHCGSCNVVPVVTLGPSLPHSNSSTPSAEETQFSSNSDSGTHGYSPETASALDEITDMRTNVSSSGSQPGSPRHSCDLHQVSSDKPWTLARNELQNPYARNDNAMHNRKMLRQCQSCGNLFTASLTDSEEVIRKTWSIPNIVVQNGKIMRHCERCGDLFTLPLTDSEEVVRKVRSNANIAARNGNTMRDMEGFSEAKTESERTKPLDEPFKESEEKDSMQDCTAIPLQLEQRTLSTAGITDAEMEYRKCYVESDSIYSSQMKPYSTDTTQVDSEYTQSPDSAASKRESRPPPTEEMLETLKQLDLSLEAEQSQENEQKTDVGKVMASKHPTPSITTKVREKGKRRGSQIWASTTKDPFTQFDDVHSAAEIGTAVGTQTPIAMKSFSSPAFSEDDFMNTASLFASKLERTGETTKEHTEPTTACDIRSKEFAATTEETALTSTASNDEAMESAPNSTESVTRSFVNNELSLQEPASATAGPLAAQVPQKTNDGAVAAVPAKVEVEEAITEPAEAFTAITTDDPAVPFTALEMESRATETAAFSILSKGGLTDSTQSTQDTTEPSVPFEMGSVESVSLTVGPFSLSATSEGEMQTEPLSISEIESMGSEPVSTEPITAFAAEDRKISSLGPQEIALWSKPLDDELEECTQPTQESAESSEIFKMGSLETMPVTAKSFSSSEFSDGDRMITAPLFSSLSERTGETTEELTEPTTASTAENRETSPVGPRETVTWSKPLDDKLTEFTQPTQESAESSDVFKMGSMETMPVTVESCSSSAFSEDDRMITAPLFSSLLERTGETTEGHTEPTTACDIRSKEFPATTEEAALTSTASSDEAMESAPNSTENATISFFNKALSLQEPVSATAGPTKPLTSFEEGRSESSPATRAHSELQTAFGLETVESTTFTRSSNAVEMRSLDWTSATEKLTAALLASNDESFESASTTTESAARLSASGSGPVEPVTTVAEAVVSSSVLKCESMQFVADSVDSTQLSSTSATGRMKSASATDEYTELSSTFETEALEPISTANKLTEPSVSVKIKSVDSTSATAEPTTLSSASDDESVESESITGESTAFSSASEDGQVENASSFATATPSSSVSKCESLKCDPVTVESTQQSSYSETERMTLAPTVEEHANLSSAFEKGTTESEPVTAELPELSRVVEMGPMDSVVPVKTESDIAFSPASTDKSMQFTPTVAKPAPFSIVSKGQLKESTPDVPESTVPLTACTQIPTQEVASDVEEPPAPSSTAETGQTESEPIIEELAASSSSSEYESVESASTAIEPEIQTTPSKGEIMKPVGADTPSFLFAKVPAHKTSPVAAKCTRSPSVPAMKSMESVLMAEFAAPPSEPQREARKSSSNNSEASTRAKIPTQESAPAASKSIILSTAVDVGRTDPTSATPTATSSSAFKHKSVDSSPVTELTALSDLRVKKATDKAAPAVIESTEPSAVFDLVAKSGPSEEEASGASEGRSTGSKAVGCTESLSASEVGSTESTSANESANYSFFHEHKSIESASTATGPAATSTASDDGPEGSIFAFAEPTTRAKIPSHESVSAKAQSTKSSSLESAPGMKTRDSTTRITFPEGKPSSGLSMTKNVQDKETSGKMNEPLNTTSPSQCWFDPTLEEQRSDNSSCDSEDLPTAKSISDINLLGETHSDMKPETTSAKLFPADQASFSTPSTNHQGKKSVSPSQLTNNGEEIVKPKSAISNQNVDNMASKSKLIWRTQGITRFFTRKWLKKEDRKIMNAEPIVSFTATTKTKDSTGVTRISQWLKSHPSESSKNGKHDALAISELPLKSSTVHESVSTSETSSLPSKNQSQTSATTTTESMSNEMPREPREPKTEGSGPMSNNNNPSNEPNRSLTKNKETCLPFTLEEELPKTARSPSEDANNETQESEELIADCRKFDVSLRMKICPSKIILKNVKTPPEIRLRRLTVNGNTVYLG